MTLYLIAATILILVIWFFIGIKKIGQLSLGPIIDDRPNSAVLLIDLQTVFWDSDIYDAESKAQVQTAVVAEVSHAKDAGIPVIAMRQEWSIASTKMVARLLMKGQALAGSKGVELALPFANLADHILIKRIQDAFETGELDALLKQLNVGKLRILGLDGNYCVAQTALSACQRGFHTEMVTAGVLVGDQTKHKRVLVQLNKAGVVLI